MAARKDNTAELFEAFQRFMTAQGTAVNETVPERKTVKRPTRSSGRKAAKINAERNVTVTKPSRKTAKGVITCAEAWTALGADPTYKPSDPNAPARNGQLWALNAAGKLRLS